MKKSKYKFKKKSFFIFLLWNLLAGGICLGIAIYVVIKEHQVSFVLTKKAIGTYFISLALLVVVPLIVRTDQYLDKKSAEE